MAKIWMVELDRDGGAGENTRCFSTRKRALEYLLEKISGIIPTATPVIVKCASNDPANNKIKPVTTDGTKVSGNKLGAVYCSLYQIGHINMTNYNKSTMRILGSSNGKLAFVKATADDLFEGQALWENRAYLNVPAGSPDVLVEGGTGITTINATVIRKFKCL